jgi:hypothetical protein
MNTTLLYAYYPLALALLSSIPGLIITRRTLRTLSMEEKAVLLDSFARGRVAVLSMAAVVVALLFWRPLVAWLFFAAADVCLYLASWWRMGRLQLLESTRKSLRLAQFAQTVGFVTCALIFATRLSS